MIGASFVIPMLVRNIFEKRPGAQSFRTFLQFHWQLEALDFAPHPPRAEPRDSQNRAQGGLNRARREASICSGRVDRLVHGPDRQAAVGYHFGHPQGAQGKAAHA